MLYCRHMRYLRSFILVVFVSLAFTIVLQPKESFAETRVEPSSTPTCSKNGHTLGGNKDIGYSCACTSTQPGVCSGVSAATVTCPAGSSVKDVTVSGGVKGKVCVSSSGTTGSSTGPGGMSNDNNNGATNNPNALPEAQNGGQSSSTQDSDTAASETSCTPEGIGWIICPAVRFVASMNDAMFNVIEGFLKINPSTIDTSGATYKAWQSFRDIANLLFTIFFLVVVFSQLSGIGISNYGIKRTLPKMIIAAILINFSFYICQIGVDLSNIFGNALKELLANNITPASSQSGGGWESVSGAVLATGAGVVGIYALLAIGLPGIIMFFLSAAVTLLILIGRQAGVILLTALAPLAFAAWILPNTEPLFRRWWKIFSSFLLVFPIVSLLFGAGTLAENILWSAANDNLMMQIAALTVLGIPLIFTPVLLKGALNSIGTLGQRISSMGPSARRAAWGKVKSRAGEDFQSSRLGDLGRKLTLNRAKRKARVRSGNGRITQFGRRIAKAGENRGGALGKVGQVAGGLMSASGDLSQRFDQSRAGQMLGMDRGAAHAEEVADKMAMDQAELILKYQMRGDAVQGLRHKDKHVQAVAAKKLSETAWGSEQLASYIEGGGEITSVRMAEAMASTKKYDAGVSAAGVEALQIMQSTDPKIHQESVSFSQEQFRATTANAVGGMSNEQITSQTGKAIDRSNISSEMASAILDDKRLSNQLSDSSKKALEQKRASGSSSSSLKTAPAISSTPISPQNSLGSSGSSGGIILPTSKEVRQYGKKR